MSPNPLHFVARSVGLALLLVGACRSNANLGTLESEASAGAAGAGASGAGASASGGQGGFGASTSGGASQGGTAGIAQGAGGSTAGAATGGVGAGATGGAGAGGQGGTAGGGGQPCGKVVVSAAGEWRGPNPRGNWTYFNLIPGGELQTVYSFDASGTVGPGCERFEYIDGNWSQDADEVSLQITSAKYSVKYCDDAMLEVFDVPFEASELDEEQQVYGAPRWYMHPDDKLHQGLGLLQAGDGCSSDVLGDWSGEHEELSGRVVKVNASFDVAGNVRWAEERYFPAEYTGNPFVAGCRELHEWTGTYSLPSAGYVRKSFTYHTFERDLCLEPTANAPYMESVVDDTHDSAYARNNLRLIFIERTLEPAN